MMMVFMTLVSRISDVGVSFGGKCVIAYFVLLACISFIKSNKISTFNQEDERFINKLPKISVFLVLGLRFRWPKVGPRPENAKIFVVAEPFRFVARVFGKLTICIQRQLFFITKPFR
jgi:hypothetical protein